MILVIRTSLLFLDKLCHRVLLLFLRALVPKPIIQGHLSLFVFYQFLLLKFYFLQPLLLLLSSLFAVLFSPPLLSFLPEHLYHFLPLLVLDACQLFRLFHYCVRAIALTLSALRLLLEREGGNLQFFGIWLAVGCIRGNHAIVVEACCCIIC